ncbi:glycoside hydrolase family 65 protein [Thiospirochaeta perfilievii]|uniref:Glycoside hydrolase family 65 protein n=1 Tax=Thiospirochaeta perfilievii TaxID=252967 RepID=A0A5C1Q9U5_9SPIO|nr:glycosyl hydrolase family 65 protein [Thiospirochaeta perfilievii]QEN03679.1 glycoside hydrolase family 65 protein [Thiospirochaeta perfilievii]
MDEEWVIRQNNFEDIEDLKKNETLFTLGNGFLGIRGDLIQEEKSFQKGTYINGFYEKGPIKYGENAYGYAQNWQTMISLPEGKEIDFVINNEKLFNPKGRFIESCRILNMRESYTKWSFKWEDSKSNIISGSLLTIVPFDYRGTVLYRWDFEFANSNNQVKINSKITYNRPKTETTKDPRISAHFDHNSISVDKSESDNSSKILNIVTSGSSLILSSIMDHQVSGGEYKVQNSELDEGLSSFIDISAGSRLSITKIITYDYDIEENRNLLSKRLISQQSKALKDGFESIILNQRSFMESFWSRSDIKLDGNIDIQRSIRFNLFQLLQSTGRDGKRSIAAKGLSGPGYEGHYFWDAETYVLPFFIYTNPEIAKSMLLYRISIMDKARERADILGHKGILFPWRTINGEESSAYFPAGTAQYHINADIALGLSKYLEITGDLTILDQGGCELLSGTANFWCSLGDTIEGKGFCFNGVTGPDEYTALVDNNFYTNIMAKKNLEMAAYWLNGRHDTEEVNLWIKRAGEIYLPKNIDITPQDDSFLGKEKWDFKNTSDDKYPLLLNFHPLNIYRKQVLKQADTVMAQFLFRDFFPPGLLKRNFDYYEEVTTRDSSLSACAQGINANWLGYEDLAWEYFLETVHTDLKDLHQNVFHGLHTASMGGSYLIILFGFLGLDTRDGNLMFRPRLPRYINNLELNVSIMGGELNIKIKDDKISYTPIDGDIEIFHFSNLILLSKNETKTMSLYPRVKLHIKLDSTQDRLNMEESIFDDINKHDLLPEEVMIISSGDNIIKYLNYFSQPDLKTNDDLENLYRDSWRKNREFIGFRPKIK